MTKLLNFQSLYSNRPQAGQGLCILMVMLMSMVMLATSLQMTVNSGLPGLYKSMQDKTTARSVALAALPLARDYVQTQLNNNVTVSQGTQWLNQNLTVPSDPTNLGGSTSAVGTFSMTVTRQNGNYYLLSVTATAGGATDTETRLWNIKKYTAPVVAVTNARFLGRVAGDETGWVVSSAGDVNGDGYADLLISGYDAAGGGSYRGETYLIMGRSATNWASLVDASGNFALTNMNWTTNKMVRFLGRANSNYIGNSISSAGDVNGDGYADLLIGADNAAGGGTYRGETYLIMGRSDANWGSLVDASGNFALTNMNWTTNKTVRFLGRVNNDSIGYTVSSAGDVDKDGYADLLIGTPWASGGSGTGEAYLIMGRPDANWGTLVDASGNFALTNMNWTTNKTVRFLGRANNDASGYGISTAGDVNGDGYADLLIGAYGGAGAGAVGSYRGESYLIMGRSDTSWGSLVDASGNFALSSMNWTTNKTVRFLGRADNDYSGNWVSTAGDVNGDAIPDLLIGAYQASNGSVVGEAYLIPGRSNTSWGTFVDASGNVNLLTVFP